MSGTDESAESNDINRKATRRGRRLVKGGDLVCSVCPSYPSFQTKKEMTDHKNKVHRFVKCGGCEPKKVITFSSYKQTHIKAFPNCKKILPIPWNKEDQCEASWVLPEDFRVPIPSEAMPQHDKSSNKDANNSNEEEQDSAGGTTIESDAVEEDNYVVAPSEDEDLDYLETSVSSSANDGTCDVDESFTVQEIIKYDRMTKKRQADVSNDNEFQLEKRARPHSDPKTSSLQIDKRGRPPPDPETSSHALDCDEMAIQLSSKEPATRQGAVEETENFMKCMTRLYEQNSICNQTVIFGKSAQTIGDHTNSYRVCRNVMEMWKCWNGSKTTGDVVNATNFMGSNDTIKAVLLFLHTGSGIVKADLLINFLNDNPTKLVSLYVVIILIMCSLNSMGVEELQIVYNNFSKLETCEFMEVIKLCFMRKLFCSDVLGKPSARSSPFDLEVNEFHRNICGKNMESCRSPNNCAKLIKNSIDREILSRAKSVWKEAAIHRRCMEYNATVTSYSFQFELLHDYMSLCGRDEENMVQETFMHNFDPFSSELDEAFNFSLIRQDEYLTLYIHELVLRLRLGVEDNSFDNTLSLIRRSLSKGKKAKNFQLKDVLQFWRFLYSDHRNSFWPENYSVTSMIRLAVTFKLPNVPFFLFKTNDPETPTLMKYFVNCYLCKKDDRNIGRMCKLLNQDSTLMSQLNTKQVYEVLVNDSVPLSELEVYTLVVKFSNAKPCDEEDEEYKTFQERFTKLRFTIRYGLMNEIEFEKVDEDGHLGPNICSVFFYNIKRKHKISSRLAEIPGDFVKPFEPRKDE